MSTIAIEGEAPTPRVAALQWESMENCKLIAGNREVAEVIKFAGIKAEWTNRPFHNFSLHDPHEPVSAQGQRKKPLAR